jgi:hypothetical protein
MYVGLHVKWRLLLADCNDIWIFSADFTKNSQTSNCIKILPFGVELFHRDRRTDTQTDKQTDRQTDRHDEASSRFSQSAERAQKLITNWNTTHRHWITTHCIPQSTSPTVHHRWTSTRSWYHFVTYMCRTVNSTPSSGRHSEFNKWQTRLCTVTIGYRMCRTQYGHFAAQWQQATECAALNTDTSRDDVRIF